MQHTYGLFYPENYPIKEKAGTMFYFGKGSNLNRRDKHEYEASRNIERNPHKNNVIREIWSFGYSVLKRNFFSFKTNDDACMYEIATIILMPQLTNIAIGVDSGMYGRTHTPEAIEKTRLALLGNKNRLGHHHTSDAIEKMHLAKLGNKHSLGYHHTPETIKKMRLAKLGKQCTPERNEKIRLARLGKKHTPATIAKMQQSALNRWSSNK